MNRATAGPSPAEGDAIDVLWSGGFDSTFRVLQTLLVEGRRVRPHYVIDPRRRSTAHELEACERIRAGLARSHPEAAARLFPPRITSRDDLPPDPSARRLFLCMKSEWNVGAQIEWLAHYARHAGLDAVELGWERSHSRRDRIGPMLRGNTEGAGHDRRLRADLDNPEAEVLRPFRFPVLHLTKGDMLALAVEHGFSHLLAETWFCHDPESGRPCGRCIPCEYAYAAGLAHRISRWRRLRLGLRRLLRRSSGHRSTRRFEAWQKGAAREALASEAVDAVDAAEVNRSSAP